MADDKPIDDGQQSDSERSDADAWLSQWRDLFDDDGDETGSAGAAPPTAELPPLQSDSPPIDADGQPLTGVGPPPPDGQLSAAGQGAASNQSRAAGQSDATDDSAEVELWQRAEERRRRRAKMRANQRKAQELQRHRADEPLPIDQSLAPDVATVGSQVQRSVGPSRATLIGGGALLLAAVMVIGYLLTGSGGDEGDVEAADDAQQNGLDFNLGADVGPVGIDELTLSTVQLIGLTDDGQPECAGSGVIVRADGMILTNAHVVTSDRNCTFSSIGVALTVDENEPAELLYRADVLAVDTTTDLAVLRVAEPLPDVDTELPETFVAAPLGDSDKIDLGDEVRILGYPVIGGETITLTTGSVSGFTAQPGLGVRALVKTDASISAGNSGGMAVDAEGRVIGIPTKARASATGPAIDCRPFADTNNDGAVDADDTCVPVGGFLNGIRPINLAIALIGRAAVAEPIGPVVLPEVIADFDISQVSVTNPRFALGVEDNEPVDLVETASAGLGELCFFVDWEGIPPGVGWDSAWFIDGVLQPRLGYADQVWNLAESGTNFWLCAEESGSDGLPAGVYEIGIFFDGELLFAEGIIVTSGPVEVVEVTWINDTDARICSLAINPFSSSGQVGLNELPPDTFIEPGGSRTVELPLGMVVVEAYDCEGEAIADNLGGLPITAPASFVIGL